jgi:PAS domain S-box-containing protein
MTDDLNPAPERQSPEHQIEAVQALLSEMQQALPAAAHPRLSTSILETSVVLEEMQVMVEALRLQNEALITAQHQLENERRRYHTLFDSAPDAYVVTDPQGTIETLNQLAARLLRVPAAWAVGKPLAVFVAEADRAGFYAQLRGAAGPRPAPDVGGDAAGTSLLQGQEVSLLPRGLPPFKVALSASVERDRSGAVVRLQWRLGDLSDRQRLELALKTSEAQLGQILNSAIALILSFRIFENGDWEYDYFSSGCESILGYPPEAFVADKTLWRSRMHPDDLGTLDQLFADLFAERSTAWEYRFRHRDGSLRWLSNTYTSQKIADGCWQITVVGQDVSDRKQLELALTASEARLSSILDSANAAIVSFRLMADKTWQYDYFSAGCERVFGYTPAEFMADPPLLLSRVVPEDLDANLQPFIDAVLAGESPTVDYRVRHRDGSLRWISCTHAAQPLGEGVWQITAINQDMTHQKQLELALAASEARASRILHSAGAAIGEFRVYGDRTYVNDFMSAGCEMVYGYPAEYLRSHPEQWMARIVPEDQETIVERAFEQILAGGTLTVEYRFLDQGDRLRWISETLMAQWDEADACWRVTTVATDITERKQLALALTASEARLSSILNSANAAIISFQLFRDGTWQYDYFSVGCETLLGFTPAELLADPNLFLSRVEPADLDALFEPFLTAIFAGEAPSFECRFHHRDGSLRWLSCTHASQPIGEGAWQVTAINQDVTHQKQLELALATSEAKLSDVLDSAIAAISSFRVYASGDFEYEYWSGGCERLFGYSLEDYDDQGFWLAQVHPDDLEQRLMPLFESFYAEREATAEYRFHCQNGELRWFSSVYNSRKIAEDCWLITAINYDITDRKRAEADLRDSERKLRAAFNGTFEFMSLLTPDGTLIDANRAALDVIAADLESVVGQPFWQTPWWAHFPEQQRLLRQMIGRAARGETIQSETQHVWADGTQAWIDFSLKPILDEAGQVVMLMPEGRDITDRKQAEITLRQQSQQEYLLNDITQDIRQSLDLAAVLARTVERSRVVLQSDRVIVFRLLASGEGEVVAESVGDGFESILATTIYDPCFGDRYVEAYRQGRVGVIDDIEGGELEPCHADLLRRFQVRANLVVPILQGELAQGPLPPAAGPPPQGRGDGLWGLLIAHQCCAPRQWQPAEVTLLKRIATKASVAIQQSELYGQVLQELRKREQIQQVLQESEARFRTLSATAPVGIGQIDADGHCVYTNARWREISGLSAEASLGDGWIQVVHAEDRPLLVLAWEEFLAGQRQQLPEFRLLTPAGDLRWVAAAIAPLRTATGDIYGYVSTVEDITQRKQADQKIRQQATLLDIASDAIFVRDLDHRIHYWNRGAERLYGWSAAEALGQPCQNLLRGDLPYLDSIMEILLEQGEWQGEINEITKTGQPVTVAARWTLVYDEAHQPRFILSVETDITEQKNLQAQFFQAQRLESLGHLASGIAHDLNNLLTPILTMAQLLQDSGALGPAAQEPLRLIENSARRGTSMVQQILSITRSSGDIKTVVDVVPLLQDLAGVLQSSLPKAIAIDLALPADLAPVCADPTHLHQVFMNLCINARDAMPTGGTLAIAAEAITLDAATVAINIAAQVGDYVRVTVADTGTGIDPAVRDRIFDPFFTTKGPGRGTGLGLATVMAIVKGSGGFVQVASEAGQGTQVQVYLPALATAPTAPSAAPDRAGPPATPLAPQLGRGELILVVDDDLTVQHTTQALLERQGYRTLVADNGQAALHCYRQHQATIQLVVLDMMMPTLDGIALIERLLALNPRVKTLAISGLPAYREPALAAGASAFLAKPYDLVDLLGAIATLVQPKGER